MKTTLSLNQLTAAGGRLWERDTMRRVYFDCRALYGLTVTLYKTGNVCSACLDGERISNSEANRLGAVLGNTKLWVDLATGEVHLREAKYNPRGYEVAGKLLRRLVELLDDKSAPKHEAHEVCPPQPNEAESVADCDARLI